MSHKLRKDESGIALLTVMLVLMLAAGLMAGMFAAVMADQRSHGIDRDQSRSYAAAHAGLEKLTTELARLFQSDVSPNATQITTASSVPPAITGFNFTSPGGGSGYAITFNPDTNPGPNFGNPVGGQATITAGPYSGFQGLITPYTLTVTARSASGSEVRLRREMQTVAVPVFQFGIFGQQSLSYFAGTAFTFGGRVHSNLHLFLAAGSATNLTFGDKLTAVGQVVRAQLENGSTLAAAGAAGPVNIPVVIGVSTAVMAANEGSVVAGPASGPTANWSWISGTKFNTNVRNSSTGVTPLDLPLVSAGLPPIAIIQRPALGSNEDATNAPVFGQRFYSQASLRILLSDRVADFTTLPTITATAPTPLDGSWNPGGTVPPVARSVGPNSVAISSTGGAGSGTGTITFASTPNWLRMAGVGPAGPVITIGTSTVSGCTGIDTANQLTGCTVAGTSVPYNTNFTVALDASIGGGTAQLRTAAGGGTVTVGGGKIIPLVSARDLTLGSRVVWAGNNSATCRGYSTTQLTGCYWTTAPSGTLTTHALSTAAQSLLGGFIKIERQGPVNTWTDVTTEILGLGFAAPNQEGTSAMCADPTPNAVLRLQRLRDNGNPTPATVACSYGGSLLATDFWPNNLYDAREGAYRDVATTTNPMMGGVIGYVALDVGNLRRWLTGAIGTTGLQALNNNGFIVYFSDRRGDHDENNADVETGVFGAEDGIDLNDATWPSGSPNQVLDADSTGTNRPEDVDGDNALDRYGETPSALALPAGAAAPFNAAGRPWTSVSSRPQARVNRVVLFRRALKVMNGCIGEAAPVGGCTAANGVNNLPAGLTVAAENPVYVQGNYNATSTNTLAAGNVPAALVGDTITFLSNSWTDVSSFINANDQTSRNVAQDAGYRFAMISGRSRPFIRPAGWAPQALWGTDGGVHNFMRMLEDWSGRTTNYRGSMVSLYYSRQLVGTFKLNQNVYTQGTRNFNFDITFLNPAGLPPGTPMFRAINTLRFRQLLRPNQ